MKLLHPTLQTQVWDESSVGFSTCEWLLDKHQMIHHRHHEMQLELSTNSTIHKQTYDHHSTDGNHQLGTNDNVEKNTIKAEKKTHNLES